MTANNELKRSGIYVINNRVGFHKYVGQAFDIAKRWHDHKTQLRNNTHHNIHLQNAWNKYGERNFSFEVLEFCRTVDLDDKEQYWIEKLNLSTTSLEIFLNFGI